MSALIQSWQGVTGWIARISSEHTGPVIYGLSALLALAIGVAAGNGSIPHLFLFVLTPLLAILCLSFFHDRALAVALLVFTFPLEITKVFIPFLQTSQMVDGIRTSSLDLFRIMLLVFIGLWLLSSIKLRQLKLPSSPLFNVFYAWFAIYVVSAVGIAPDKSKAMSEVIRLTASIMMMVVVYDSWTSGDQRQLYRSLKLIFAFGVILAALGLLQYYSDFYLWRADLQRLGGTDEKRINVTFMDPNIYARYLVLYILLGIHLLRQTIHKYKPLLVVCLVLCFVVLLLTNSRGGWFSLLGGLFVYRTLDRGGNLLKASLALFGWLLLAGVALLFFPDVLERLLSFKQGIRVLGARLALIITGFKMYIDYPIFGVGVAGYQTVGLNAYKEFLPLQGEGVSMSHTSVITIMAELGTIGLIVLGAMITRLGRIYKSLVASDLTGQQRDLLAFSFASLAAIFISSQGEGRLFEENMLWLYIGLLAYLVKSKLAATCA